jgi:ABC-type transporter Mla MlaB component
MPSTPGPHTLGLAIRGPIARSDLPGLCARVCARLDGVGEATVLCGVEGIEPDAVTVDALARLQLAARRQGCRVRLRGASANLLELVAFMGLSHVLPADDGYEAPATPGTRAGARTAGTASPRRGRT